MTPSIDIHLVAETSSLMNTGRVATSELGFGVPGCLWPLVQFSFWVPDCVAIISVVLNKTFCFEVYMWQPVSSEAWLLVLLDIQVFVPR